MSPARKFREFAEQTNPDHEEVARARARVLAALDAQVLKAAGGGALLLRGMLSGALVAAGVAGALLWMTPALPGPDEAPLPMVSEADWSTLAPTPEVDLEFRGKGSIRGTRAAPRVEWRSGTLHAAVEPARGVDLRVRTPDATVTVLGTEFDVERTAPGTTVRVDRGRVHVACDLGGARTLIRGQSHTCLPTTAAGLLGRARHLQLAGADTAEILTSIELGLGRPNAPAPVVEELRFVKVEVLAESGRRSEAYLEAKALLREGAEHRKAELIEIVRNLRR